MRFETAVKEIIQRTHNVKSFRFARPNGFSYRAGQFIMVTIRGGENVLIKPFSLSSSPTEDYVEFTKKLTGHEYSNALDAMKTGDWTEINGPHGTFTLEGEHPKVCMLSGGIGITPLRSICKYCADTKVNTSIILLYGNRTETDIAFREDLEQMQHQSRNLRVIHVLQEFDERWRGAKGIINAELLRSEVPDYAERVFYTCGPPGMVQAMTILLKSLSIPAEQIRTEDFAGYQLDATTS